LPSVTCAASAAGTRFSMSAMDFWSAAIAAGTVSVLAPLEHGRRCRRPTCGLPRSPSAPLRGRARIELEHALSSSVLLGGEFLGLLLARGLRR